ncbi:MAG: M23 family metallopeptidase [Oscillospiraceae bacterium]|nr:M23 family metallopeptidase [Oscillospiraceae bacterium]
MNSPYMGNFTVTQKYKGSEHDGLDLVGLDSKEIHATVCGKVDFAGWENPSNHSQGFGQYVKIIDDKSGYGYYYGHLSEIKVKVGDYVKTTDVIGIEGSTGYSTGSHCHYCIRKNGKGTHIDVSAVSGIPNIEGGTYNDGYASVSSDTGNNEKSMSAEIKINGITYSGILTSK